MIVRGRREGGEEEIEALVNEYTGAGHIIRISSIPFKK